jgi:hypothetical protein
LCRPLRDRLQHITGPGDVRKIDLWLEFVGRHISGARRAACAGLVLRKVLLYSLRFVLFNRAGVGFLFDYADLRQNIEDFLAFHLKFSSQIVDSNLVQHSALFPPLFPVWLHRHSTLTVYLVCRLAR